MCALAPESKTATKQTPLRCWVEVNLDSLVENWRAIRRHLPSGMQCISVLKANAYGHGAQEAAACLKDEVDGFAVATLAEAAAIRAVVPGKALLVLSPILPEEAEWAFTHDCIPTVSSVEEVQLFAALAQKHRTQLPITLKVDTGLGRVGVWHAEAQALLQVIRQHSKHLRLHGVCTHFSCANEDAAFTNQQRRILENFVSEAALSPDVLVHADNSPGLKTFTAIGPYSAIRIGRLQFGVTQDTHNALPQPIHTVPVLSLRAKVSLIKIMPAGIDIGYGRTHHLTSKTTLAVLAAGYADGIPSALSNKGQILLHGQRCPILGRISMDQTVVDISALPHCAVGDTATFLGTDGQENLSLLDWYNWISAYPLECLCAFNGTRMRRVYMGAKH